MATWQVAADGDDGSVWDPGNNYNAAGSPYLGKGAVNVFSHWLRFLNVTIPQGAVIITAVLVYTDRTGESGTTVKVRFKGDDTDTATAPISYANYWAKARTTAFTDWSPGAWVAETEYTSPSIVGIIQEIVDRPLFASGNDLQVFCEENGSDANAVRVPYHHDNDPAKAPKLVVTYKPAKHTFRLHPGPGDRMRFHPNLKLG